MQACVFDLDGTLLDTLADIAAAANQALEADGRSGHPVSAYARMVGNGFETLMARAMGEPLPSAEKLGEIVGCARKAYAAKMMINTRPYPGMIAALQKLSACGFQLAVLSNKPDNLSRILISHYFPMIPFAKVVGARAGVPLKPDPAGLLDLLESLGVKSDKTFYVGDSNVDMATARAAGCVAVGCAWGFRGAPELLGAGADRVLAEPAELAMLCADSL